MSSPSQQPAPTRSGRNATNLAFYGCALLVALVDAASKYAVSVLQPEPGTSVFGGLLLLQRHYNSGYMLGIGSSLDADYRSLVLSAITAVVLLGLLGWLLYRGFSRIDLALAWGAVVGSAGANLLERMRDGAVTDFLQLNLAWVQTGIFNLADLFNLAGLCYIAANVLFRNRAL